MRGLQIVEPRTIWMSDSSGCCWPRGMRGCARARRRRCRAPARSSSARCAGRAASRSSPAAPSTSAGAEPGLLGQLAHHAAFEIDRVAHDIVRVGRARRENRSVRRSRCGRPSRRAGTRRRTSATPPSAKQLRIDVSGKPQSRHAMKLAKSVSRYAPAEHAVGDLAAAHQQHAPVPHLRLRRRAAWRNARRSRRAARPRSATAPARSAGRAASAE